LIFDAVVIAVVVVVVVSWPMACN